MTPNTRALKGQSYCSQRGQILFAQKGQSRVAFPSIEKKAFEEMVSKLNGFIAGIETLYLKGSDKKMSDWMDSQDVCMLLDISPRTLQTLRDSGRLAYSQINHKIYYLPEDVERILPVMEKKKESMKTQKQNAYG